jgi:hypothetical protein
MQPALSDHYVTGGASNRTVANFLGARLVDLLAGGPLDAPIALPAGSCNSTDVRRGPWDDGGRYVAAQSVTAREV